MVFALCVNFICSVNVLCIDKSNGAVSDMDGRTSRPGPVGVSFEITDAQIMHEDGDKYVVRIL